MRPLNFSQKYRQTVIFTKIKSMKKLLSILLTVLIGVSCLSLSAQVNTQLVANGTVSSNYVPVYGLWADAAQHNQIVYPAGMLSNMVGGEIQSMKFFFSSTPSTPWSGPMRPGR